MHPVYTTVQMKVQELEEQQGRKIYLSRSEYLSTNILPWTTHSPYKKSCPLCTDQWQVFNFSLSQYDHILGRRSWSGLNLDIPIIQYTISIVNRVSKVWALTTRFYSWTEASYCWAIYASIEQFGLRGPDYKARTLNEIWQHSIRGQPTQGWRNLCGVEEIQGFPMIFLQYLPFLIITE